MGTDVTHFRHTHAHPHKDRNGNRCDFKASKQFEKYLDIFLQHPKRYDVLAIIGHSKQIKVMPFLPILVSLRKRVWNRLAILRNQMTMSFLRTTL